MKKILMKKALIVSVVISMLAVPVLAQNSANRDYRNNQSSGSSVQNRNNSQKSSAPSSANVRNANPGSNARNGSNASSGNQPQNKPQAVPQNNSQNNRNAVPGNKPQGSPQGNKPNNPGGGNVYNGNGFNNGRVEQPRSPEKRMEDAKRQYNDARQGYKNEKQQIRVDQNQRPAYYGNGYSNPEPRMEKRPPIPREREFSLRERTLRTNASRIVIQTNFMSREDAAMYVRDLLESRYYGIDYMSPNLITTQYVEIPSSLISSSLFSMRFSFVRTSFGVRITISSNWRSSGLVSDIVSLIFQPDPRYATYYAWNVLEDIASEIPHSSIYFQ